MSNNIIKQVLTPSAMCLLFVGGLLLTGCKQNTNTPKPKGYPRIDFPERGYQEFDSTCPFSFQYPSYATIVPNQSKDAQDCWINILYKPLGAKLYLSYQDFNNQQQLNTLKEDARTLVYKHTVKASQIKENQIKQDTQQVEGIFYELGGNAATAIQFYVTDTDQHYLRGSLYFEVEPNRDSLDPVIDYLKKDIVKMINTLEWKQGSKAISNQ